MHSKRQQEIEGRVLDELYYIIEFNATVRATAEAFGTSKSTVHKDIVKRADKFLSEGVEGFSSKLIKGAKSVLAKNKAERHIRGGLATKEKYTRLKYIYQ